ncbi:MAG: zinc metallopeptidase [Verrucomicrobiales bacterium]|nr:zinc metallopeptidase [Verrucomicrobiales bacterium]
MMPATGWFLILPGLLLALWARWKLSSTYSRYSQIGTESGISGAEAARVILDRNGLRDVEILPVPGELTDHYDPAKRAVFLSEGVYQNPSLAAVGVAAHEVGHALQHQQGYGPLGLRMALVPITGFASNAAIFLVFGGLFLGNILGPMSSTLLWIGVGCYALMALFQIITLPVEYDASDRARAELSRLGLVSPRELPGVRQVLGAAALTYVAAMLTAVLELVRLIMIARSNDDRHRG